MKERVLQQVAYERYKLLWMIRYDKSLLDLAERIVFEERRHPECKEMTYTDAAYFLLGYAEKTDEEREDLYPDYAAFISGIYTDEATMAFLLTEEEKKIYDYFRKTDKRVLLGSRFSFEGTS